MASMRRALSGCQIFDDDAVLGGWKCVPLGDRVELAYGTGLREKNREPGGVDVYGSNGVVGHHKEALAWKIHNGPRPR